MRYLFHVHRALPAWRLVIREDLGLPAATSADQWKFTRARASEDVNADVRDDVDRQGWHLFRLGGTFAEIEAELARQPGGADSRETRER